MNSKPLILVATGLLCAGCVSTSAYRKEQAETARLQKENEALAAQVTSLRNERAALEESAKSKEAEIARLKGTYEQLMGSLKDEIAKGEIQVTQLKDKLTVNLVEKILFDSGRAQIKAGGMEVLDRIAGVLKNVQDKDIRIEGHTDNVPVGPRLRERYGSNWELSAARAVNILKYLQENGGIDPSHLIAAGFGEYHPIASNDTPEGQAQNRRIDIVLVARDTAPPATPAASTGMLPVAPTPPEQE